MEIATIETCVNQINPEQLQVFRCSYSTSTLRLPKKKGSNKQASVSRICSYSSTLKRDYICQVFVTGEALADTGSFAISLLLSPLLCHPVLLACWGSSPSCKESSAVTAKAASFPKRLLFTPSAALQTNKPSHSIHYPNKVILNPYAEICLLTGLWRSTCHCQSLVLRMRIMKV